MKAIYAGTFDPVTMGHVDILSRASRCFQRIIWAIAQSTKKQTMLTLRQRFVCAQEVAQRWPNVKVCTFDGLLKDFAQRQQIHILLRGVRNTVDVSMEMQLAGMNRSLAPDLETFLLPSSARWQYVSSSVVRELLHLGDQEYLQYVPNRIHHLLNLFLSKEK